MIVNYPLLLKDHPENKTALIPRHGEVGLAKTFERTLDYCVRSFRQEKRLLGSIEQKR